MDRTRRSLLVGLATLTAEMPTALMARIGGTATSETMANRLLPTLPSATIADTGLAFGVDNRTRFVTAGNITIPLGDWMIALTVKVASGAYNINAAICIGAKSDTVVNDNGTLVIAYNGAGQSFSIDPYRGSWGISGRDDNGVAITNRRCNPYNFGGSTPVITGPRNRTARELGIDNVVTLIFQKNRNQFELWIVEPGSTARLHYTSDASAFGAITSKPLVLGMLNRAASNANNYAAGGLTVQRLSFFAGQIATARQMEAMAAGVDPRYYFKPSPATDRLIAFNSISTLQTDLIGGQTITLEGTGFTTANLLPTSVEHLPRVAIAGHGQVIQRTGSITTNLALHGTLTGPDDDIYIKVQTWSQTHTTVQDFIKVARSLNGVWAGTLPGIPSNVFQWLDIVIRRGTGGTPVQLKKQFAIGIVVELLGQSLAEYMRTSGASNATGPGANYISFYSRSKSNYGSLQALYTTGWTATSGYGQGYGEVLLAEAIANAAGCAVGVLVDAVSGSAIQDWDKTPSPGYYDPAFLSIKEFKPKYIIWHQGQGSQIGDTYKLYLDILYSKLKNDICWPWKFGVLPLNNGYQHGNNLGPTRIAQFEWARDKATADPIVSLVGSVIDCKLVDRVHATADADGFGRYVDRIAQWVIFNEGLAAYSAVGPVITEINWHVGTANVDVKVAHNGGSSLRTPYAGNVTGYTCDQGLTVLLSTITNGNTIKLLLSDIPAVAPKIGYQQGSPDPLTVDANGFQTSVANAVYDNRVPVVNAELGYPVMFTCGAIQSLPI